MQEVTLRNLLAFILVDKSKFVFSLFLQRQKIFSIESANLRIISGLI